MIIMNSSLNYLGFILMISQLSSFSFTQLSSIQRTVNIKRATSFQRSPEQRSAMEEAKLDRIKKEILTKLGLTQTPNATRSQSTIQSTIRTLNGSRAGRRYFATGYSPETSDIIAFSEIGEANYLTYYLTYYYYYYYYYGKF